jgi:MFS family permease
MLRTLSWSQRLLVSLNYGEYRRLWVGTMFTQMAIQMAYLTLGWYVLEITNSAFWVGVVAFAHGLPLLIWSPLAGSLADRVEPTRVLLAAMLLAVVGVVAVVFILLAERVSAWHLAGLSFMIGSSFSLFAPARSTLLVALVPSELISNASAFQYSSTRLAGFAGPVLGGMLVERFDVVPTLLVVLGLFSAASIVYLLVKSPAEWQGKKRSTGGVFRGLAETLRYARSRGSVFELVLLGLVVVPLGMTYQHLLPVYARDVLRVGPEVLGLMAGLGFFGTALVGFVVAVVDERLHKGSAVLLSALGSGCGLIVLSFLESAPLAIGLLLVLGVVNGLFLTICAVLYHLLPPPELRGRLMGLWGVVWGMAPFAALGSGAVADLWGVQAALLVSGSICATLAAVIMVRGSSLRGLR